MAAHVMLQACAGACCGSCLQRRAGAEGHTQCKHCRSLTCTSSEQWCCACCSCCRQGTWQARCSSAQEWYSSLIPHPCPEQPRFQQRCVKNPGGSLASTHDSLVAAGLMLPPPPKRVKLKGDRNHWPVLDRSALKSLIHASAPPLNMLGVHLCMCRCRARHPPAGSEKGNCQTWRPAGR